MARDGLGMGREFRAMQEPARARIEGFSETLRATWREVCARNAAGALSIMAADAAAMCATIGTIVGPAPDAQLRVIAR